MGKKTKENALKAFVGEAKAYFRLLAYAEKAEEEGIPQAALLFKAIAEAEKIHAMKNLSLIKELVVKDTDTNLENSFQREKTASENDYPEFIKDAHEEKDTVAEQIFTHLRDAESVHMKLYERAIYHMIKDKITTYYVCTVCGYVSDNKLPNKCPICGADKEKFKTIK